MNTTFIAGPCVIESAELLDTVAARLTEINRRLGVQIIFKASFDKANRTSALFGRTGSSAPTSRTQKKSAPRGVLFYMLRIFYSSR